MPDVPTPVEVGFSDFIARLISEVFASVVTAQAEQEERYAELLAAAALPPEDYAAQYLSDEELQNELQKLFPARKEDKKHPHAIYVDSPYHPAKGEQLESPPLAAIDVTLDKSDLKRQPRGPLVLRQKAVDKVSARVAEMLAVVRLNILKEIAARGVARVQVDSGRINGKMTFHLLEDGGAESTSGAPGEPAGTSTGNLASVAQFGSLSTTTLKSILLPQARILPNVRVLVRQADERAPSSSQVTANVFGEVEITFKTIT